MRSAQLVAAFSLALAALLALLPVGSRRVAAQAAAGTIAYAPADTLDEIRLIEPDGSNDRHLWAHGRADPEKGYDISNLAWRPDSSELAFASTHENWCSINHRDIFVVGSNGAGYRRITEAPACAALAAYPKGTVQVPVRNSSSESFVGFVYFQGAPSAQQVSLPPGGSATVTFTDVADFGNGELQIATMVQGARRYIAGGTAVDVQAGGTVRSGSMSVFSLSISYIWETHSATWSSDGSAVGYILNYDSLRRISPNPAPLDFGTELQTDQGQMPDFADLLAWGPAARANQLLYAGNVAFASEGAYLLTAGSASGGEQLVEYESYQNIRGLAWLPDGSGFVFAVAEDFGDTKANLFVYSFASRQATRLTDFDDEFAGQLSVSPDGQRIVFERSASTEDGAATDLWLINRDGSGLRLLARNAARPAWSRGALVAPAPPAPAPPQPLPGPSQLPPRAYLPLSQR